MIIFCYGITYFFEQFISYQYFNNKFEQKRNKKIIFLIYLSSFLFQFVVSFFNAPYSNLIAFFLSNLFVSMFCFDIKWKQSIFNVFLLTAIMISTELLAMYSFTVLLKIDLLECKDNDLILFIETVSTKTLYFLVANLFSKFAQKETKELKDYSIFLFILPATSVITTASFAYLSFKLEIDYTTNVLFVVLCLILLLSNIIIFLIHEKIIDTLTVNTELQLEKQKEKINREYYKKLEQQYDSSSILIHDIKRILANIKTLSLTENNENISEYINSIYHGYEIQSLQQYSKNKLANIIISRYASLCQDNNIDFNIDIRDIDFSFIPESDLTALLDNLLENSYEASKISSKKEINLIIDRRNEKYMIIKISNYSESSPKIKGNTIITSKENKMFHGIGTKSIERIVKRYDGNIKCNYSEDEHIFSVTILLKIK